MRIDLVKKVVYYIIDNHTIEEAANHFNLSRGTINNYINLIRKKGPYFDYNLAVKLNDALDKNSAAGRTKGGKNGHITYVITNEAAIKYALEIVETQKTLREVASKYNLNPATLYNSLMRINDAKVLNMIKEYYKQENNQEVGETIWKR